MLNELTQNGFTVVDKEGPILKEQGNSYIDTIIDDSVSKLGSIFYCILLLKIVNDIIIVAASEDYQIPLFKRFISKNIINNHVIISLTLNEILANTIGITDLENVIFPTHYFNGYKSKIDRLNEFKDYIKDSEGLTISMTNRMGILTNLFTILSTIINFRTYDKPSKYLHFLYHYPLTNTVAGPYDINYDGYAVGLVRLAKVFIK